MGDAAGWGPDAPAARETGPAAAAGGVADRCLLAMTLILVQGLVASFSLTVGNDPAGFVAPRGELIGCRAPLRASTPAESLVPGLAVPYSRAYSVWAVALFVTLAGTSVPVGRYAAVRFCDVSRAGGVCDGAFAVVLLVGIGGYPIEVWRERVVRGVLVLASEGIVHHSWSSDLIIGVPLLSIDPVVTMQTVRCYAAHPLLRDGLGTERAMDRIRCGDVLASEALGRGGWRFGPGA